MQPLRPDGALLTSARPVELAPAAGLTTEQAEAQLARHGPNRSISARPPTIWRRIGRQASDPLIVVLLLAAALTVATGDFSDAVIIGLVVVVNTAVGLHQETKAERALEALRSMAQPLARVVRDGGPVEIAAERVVPGDLLVLAEGDVVVADARLTEAFALLVDESALTGESVPVGKDVADTDGGGLVQAGTLVLRGRGLAVVTATGAHSALGQIAAGLSTPIGFTPLQRRIARLGRRLGELAVVLCSVVLVMGLARGESAELMVVTAVSLVVAAVPESLPAVITLALALGSRRMAKRRAIVRRLSAVETLGSITVLATDKTGTLTEGRMVVERVWVPGCSAVVTGSGYDPVGDVLVEGQRVGPEAVPPIAALLEASVLCNDAALIDEVGVGRRPLGDPMEAALLVAAMKLGLAVEAVRERSPRLAELPFDTARRCMATVHRRADGGVVLVRKGAPEVLLDSPGVAQEVAAAALQRAAELTAEGYRVLAVTVAELAEPPAELLAAEQSPPASLGLLALVDPPRAAAATTMDALRRAGITPVLITGDHEQTALHVARRVGLVEGDAAADSGQSAPGIATGLRGARVFARTTPQQKLELIRGWQRAGEVVAMTGDGVNDGPALHASDIGVAMGERGTEVARQAADLVLADDDLGSLVAAVEEGRRIYSNLRRFLLYGLAGGLAEILIMLLGPAVGIPLPLLPAQILWVNLLTHGLTGVALGAEPADADALERGPRPPSESILGDGLWQRVLALGVIVCLLSLGCGLWAEAQGWPVRTLIFLTLGAAQLGIALGVRSRLLSRQNLLIVVALPAALLLQLAGVWLAPLRELLGTASVDAAALLPVLASAALACAAARAFPRAARGRTR